MRKITSFLLLMFAIVAANAETIYYNNTNSWTDVCAYAWSGTGDGTVKALGEWPGTAMTAVEGHEGWYQIDVPTTAEKIIFNNNNNNGQTGDLALDFTKPYYNDGWTDSFEGTVEVITNVIYYNNSTTNWAEVYAYSFNGAIGGSLGSWPGTKMTAVEGHDGWYQITIHTEVDGQIIFNCGSDAGKTGNLTLDATNLYYNGSAWQADFGEAGGDGGEEATPVAFTAEYYLVGFINGADYGCETDVANMGDYHFVNGALTATFTADSYVFLKTANNAAWYMTTTYATPAAGESVVFKNTTLGTSEKMSVPGNKVLNFTLIEYSDGSLTLSYTESSTGTEVGSIEDILYTVQNGMLRVNLNSAEQVRLFTINGGVIDEAVTSDYTRQLPQGVYFLSVGNKAQKIVVF